MRLFTPVARALAFVMIVGSAAPAAAQESGEWLEVIDDAENEELIFMVGPLDLPARAGHHAIAQPPLSTGVVPIDAYLYGFDVQMVDAQGEPMTNAVLHHVNLIDPDHRELFSPVARRLFAAGSETQPASMPKVLGVPLERGQRLMVSAMFHNPTETSYPGARLKVTLKYRREGWIFPLTVYPVYIDVMGHVGEKDFDLPPGRSERYWEGSPAVAGRLLAASGHMHDHATSLSFEDVTEGKVLWQTGPELNEAGRVVGVPLGKFWWKGGIALRPDHTYRLTVVYDNPTGGLLKGGGMGVLGGVFKPARGAEWPSLDPKDPDYLANLEETRQTAMQRAMGMGATSGEHGHEHGH